MSIQELKRRGYANKSELMLHAKRRYWKENQWFGRIEHIMLTDYSHWAYMPEDGIWEEVETEIVFM